MSVERLVVEGKALVEQGRGAEGLGRLLEAVRLRPTDPQLWTNVGIALEAMGRRADALEPYAQAARFAPHNPAALLNLANTLTFLDRYEEADSLFRGAEALDPRMTHAWFSHGWERWLSGHAAEASRCYERAIALEPGHVEAHVNLSLMELLQGHFERGWEEHEWRLRTPGRAPLPWPRWDGSPLAGRRLVVHCDQGLGDAIHFVRYLDMIEGGERILGCPAPLARLFAGKADRVFTFGQPLPEADVEIPLLSLPLVLGMRYGTVPYLEAEAARVAGWRERLASLPGLRVGVVWAGNPALAHDRHRSVPPEKLAGLAVTGVSLVSLQKDAPRRPAAAVDWTGELHDFADTAALVAALDLVIAVDTAVAHLAGALGRPTWLLLQYAPDWRWGLAGETTPWYPSLRLFRQDRPGDWDRVFARVISALPSIQGV